MAEQFLYQRRSGGQPLALKQADVDRILIDIWREHDRRRSSSFAASHDFGMPKNEEAKNFLRREIYALGMHLIKHKPKWDLTKLIEKIRATKSNKLDLVQDHVFHLLLMGLYEEDSVISRQERWSIARELEYAKRHKIPPELLCGFIYQSGGRKNLNKKLKAGHFEPGFPLDM